MKKVGVKSCISHILSRHHCIHGSLGAGESEATEGLGCSRRQHTVPVVGESRSTETLVAVSVGNTSVKACLSVYAEQENDMSLSVQGDHRRVTISSTEKCRICRMSVLFGEHQN